MLKNLKQNNENKENYIRKFNEGGDSSAVIKCAFNATLLINNSGVLYDTAITSEYFFIPIENIKWVQVKSDKELTKNMVDNKISLLGDLPFPREILFFLIINYTEKDLEIEKTIQCKMAAFGATEILKARRQYIKAHPESFLEELLDPFEPKSLKEDSKTVDIPDQINKLFELFKNGALSSEEFNQKKKELLSKM